jgi:hypothetical protein
MVAGELRLRHQARGIKVFQLRVADVKPSGPSLTAALK